MIPPSEAELCIGHETNGEGLRYAQEIFDAEAEELEEDK